MKALVGVLFDLSTHCKQMVFEVRNRGQHFSSASAGVDAILKLMSYSQVENETEIIVEKRKVFSLCSLPAENRNVSNSVLHT
jgi:hypothetical protein